MAGRTRRALLWLVRALLVLLVVVGVRGDVPPSAPEVLGRDEVRTTPAERGGARTRRASAALRRLDLRTGPQIEGASTSLELTITLSADGSITTERATVSSVRTRSRSGRAPLLRTVRPADGQLLAVAVDGDGRARYSVTAADPLLLRAEFPGADGQLSGEEIERKTGSLVVSIPNDATIVAVRLYRPEGDGVTLLGDVAVNP